MSGFRHFRRVDIRVSVLDTTYIFTFNYLLTILRTASVFTI